MAPELDLGQLSEDQRVAFSQLLKTGRRIRETTTEDGFIGYETEQIYLIGGDEDLIVIIERGPIMLSTEEEDYKTETTVYFGKHVAETLRSAGIISN